MAFDQLSMGSEPVTIRMWAVAILAGAAVLLAAAPASAQIGLPGVPGLPGLPDRLPVDADRLQDGVRGRVDRALQAAGRARDLIRRSDGALEADP